MFNSKPLPAQLFGKISFKYFSEIIMVTLELSREYGYILATSLAFYLQQQIIFVVPVVMARVKYGVKAPTLYPRDSEIKSLKLSDEDVHDYNCKQRAHQNSVEVNSVFLPLFMVAGAIPGYTMNVFYAGAFMFVNRLVGGLGYSAGIRNYSGGWHLGEFYVLYVVGKAAYETLK